MIEQKKGKKVVSYKFVVCIGREKGKKKYKSTIWKPPQGLSCPKTRKMAEAEAYRWEQSLRTNADHYHGQFTNMPKREAPEKIKEEETFGYFVEQVWMPLRVFLKFRNAESMVPRQGLLCCFVSTSSDKDAIIHL